MPAQQRTRSVIVTLLGALVLAMGTALLQAPTAAAKPSTQGEFPFQDNGDKGGKSDKSSRNSEQQDSQTDERVGRAEDVGGSVITALLDMSNSIVKCGLNIATESVPCDL